MIIDLDLDSFINDIDHYIKTVNRAPYSKYTKKDLLHHLEYAIFYAIDNQKCYAFGHQKFTDEKENDAVVFTVDQHEVLTSCNSFLCDIEHELKDHPYITNDPDLTHLVQNVIYSLVDLSDELSKPKITIAQKRKSNLDILKDTIDTEQFKLYFEFNRYWHKQLMAEVVQVGPASSYKDALKNAEMQHGNNPHNEFTLKQIIFRDKP